MKEVTGAPPTSDAPLIQVRGLTKRYAGVTAVADLSFDIPAGASVALWGANGAGKTTVLHCLLGVLPAEGEVRVDGQDVYRAGKQARRRIGFVPQELALHGELTVAETVTFYARLKKVPAARDLAPLLARLDLTAQLTKPVEALSGGLKQRLALALALLADPPLLLLDEPTANLDIRARDDFIDLLQALHGEGKTLVFSTHRLEEVTALAERVLLLESGRLAIDAPPAQLVGRLGRVTTLHIYLTPPAVAPAMAALTARGLTASANGRGLRVAAPVGERAAPLNVLREAGIPVTDFAVE